MKLLSLLFLALVCSLPGQQPETKPAPPARKAFSMPGVKLLPDIEYARVNGKPLLLDIYLPEKEEPGLLPVIVNIHGGGWSAGSKESVNAVREVKRGYAVASINYRLSQEAIFPAQIEDCKAAIRWLRANAAKYHFDVAHFGVMGHSAGGHLSSLVGTTGAVKEFEKGGNLTFSSAVQAVCPLSGPTDFLQMDAHAVPAATMKHDPAQSPESRLVGGAIQENKDKVARANPITYISKATPPFLIIHGENDVLVTPHQAQLLNEALQKAGVESSLIIIPGAGHGLDGRKFEDKVDAFFDKWLKGKSQ